MKEWIVTLKIFPNGTTNQRRAQITEVRVEAGNRSLALRRALSQSQIDHPGNLYRQFLAIREVQTA